MEKYLRMVGYLILLFMVSAPYLNISISDAGLMLSGVLSAVLICAGIIMNDKKAR